MSGKYCGSAEKEIIKKQRTTPPCGHPSFVRRGVFWRGSLNSPPYEGGVALL